MDQFGTAAGTGAPRGSDTRMPSPGADRPGRRSVRPVPTPVSRTCARPSCAAPAQATLAFAYGDRVAMLAPLASEDVPQAYDLCGIHASRTRAPRGWTLEDRRSPDEPGLPGPSSVSTSTDLGGDRTVAVLAAALRAVPDPVLEDAVGFAVEAGRAAVRPATGGSPSNDGVAAAGRPRLLVEGQGAGGGRPVTRPPLALRSRD